MPTIEFAQGSTICSAGEPLQNLMFITKGKAEAVFNGQRFNFEQGDAIGLCDLSVGGFGYTYTAVTDMAVFSYPFENTGTLEKMLGDNADVANLLINSMCRQITELLKYWSVLKRQAKEAYAIINEVYPEYERLCSLYAFSAKKIAGLSDVEPAPGQAEDWLFNYYMKIKEVEPAVQRRFFANIGISLGFLCKGAQDAFELRQACDDFQAYLEYVSKFFLNTDDIDLFALLSELHSDSINIKGADVAVGMLLKRVANLLSGLTCIDRAYYQSRIGEYKDIMEVRRENQEIQEAPVSDGLKQNLADSLQIILDYSGLPAEECNLFARQVFEYRAQPDKGSSDEVVYRLRKQLTDQFYTLYQSVFINSLKDSSVPTIIKMFLNFGYVDAELAGYENADFLYSIADTLKGDPNVGVYTVCEWLTAIYKGIKEPSKNDYDEDYPAHIRELKAARKIDDKEEARLLKDLDGKLRFELENVFPVTNKITFGRITIFCPLFSEYNVQRGLESSMVTPALVKKALDEVRSVDFSAYYRETVFAKPEIGITKEYINVEVLPDVILMPNVGVRGSMWQEIEGRVRTTPARMFIPIFYLGDLKTQFITLTAEFRWELCKRIQGPRWTDLSDPSLTSEMFDYLQFYRSNRELSPDVKASVKTELVRAKNTYKTVFVSNYQEWIVYEANGSPRLNKFARRILLNYCPLRAALREKLTLNPQFAELIRRYELKQQQKLHHISLVMQKITQKGFEVPQELINEEDFLKS